MGTQPPPSPYSISGLSISNFPAPNFIQPTLPAQNFMQNIPQTAVSGAPIINPRLLQNSQSSNAPCSGVQFVKNHGDMVQNQQNAKSKKLENPKKINNPTLRPI